MSCARASSVGWRSKLRVVSRKDVDQQNAKCILNPFGMDTESSLHSPESTSAGEMESCFQDGYERVPDANSPVEFEWFADHDNNANAHPRKSVQSKHLASEVGSYSVDYLHLHSRLL
mmetsp:Transcript_3151/g.5538  ORF Transcript_3151/g.5538 Transcript_3151/m.5538 type:complete len:117 (-) Transcript_3151:890-1240(-)